MYPLNMATENYRKALELATKAAVEEVKTEFIGSEHLVYAFLLLPECEAYKILTEAGVTLEEYKNIFVPATYKTKGGKLMTPNTQKMYNRAVEAAQKEGLPATTAHVLYEILCVPTCCAARYLRRTAGESAAAQKDLIEDIIQRTESAINLLIYRKNHGEDIAAVTGSGEADRSSDSMSKRFEQLREAEKEQRERATKTDNGEKSSVKKASRRASQLPDCGIDMTERARRGKMDPVIGRKKEIEKVVQVLARRLKNNPVLIGEPGVGKSAIVEGLSQLIVSGDVPEQLLNKTVFSVDLPGMLAGTRYRGDFEEKLKNLQTC